MAARPPGIVRAVTDWDALARALARTGSGRRGAAILRERHPELAEQIARLREHDWPLALWGTGRNHDENVGQRIVEPGPLRTIAHLSGVDLPTRQCHSGLLHTYGYLFSTIDTPYGRKRDRWLQPDIARGLGLGELLQPTPPHGTLLHNVTWLLARIVWRDDPTMLRRLARTDGAVADGVRELAFDEAGTTRIVQRVRLADRRVVELGTELVPLRRRRRGGPAALLVYWCRTTKSGRRLLTAFPVQRAAARQIREQAIGSPVAVPRYNAVVDGFDEPRPARVTVSSGPGTSGPGSRGTRGTVRSRTG